MGERERLDAAAQATVGEYRWMDSTNQTPKFGQRRGRGGPGFCDQLGSGFRVAGDQLLRESEVDSQFHEAGLGAVVQVTLDPTELGDRMVDAGSAGGLQLPDSLLKFLLVGGSDQHPGDGRLH